ncbi:hypothetical protein CFC21_069534 [Triticum aestivum]|uniref:Uncharacterized protein n=2 Tax=Triticum aestivum TaxID=4565 RepID=A0A3B6LF63_WHEAT|nr:uncharacterized protein LOC119307031 [Triticum dicoccoides]XP_044386465.1 uncharacterized protein LOC123110097 [Triticum aestivum]KAF7062996.1 hypothetical protein CFC21_069534 [Triticum aestivum]
MSTTRKRPPPSSAVGQSKKPSGKAPLPTDHLPDDDPKDTLRCEALDGKPMVSEFVVHYYAQKYGQSLFLDPNVKGGYVDVRFADHNQAQLVVEQREEYPFKVTWTPTVDRSQMITPGKVELYQPPRDRDVYDMELAVPMPWTNPFPVRFEPRKMAGDPVRPIYPEKAQPNPPLSKPPFAQPIWPDPPSRDHFIKYYMTNVPEPDPST